MLFRLPVRTFEMPVGGPWFLPSQPLGVSTLELGDDPLTGLLEMMALGPRGATPPRGPCTLTRRPCRPCAGPGPVEPSVDTRRGPPKACGRPRQPQWHRRVSVEGFGRGEVDVTVKDGRVEVSATSRREVDGSRDTVELRRMLTIPSDVDETTVRAGVTCDGQLHVIGQWKPPVAAETRHEGEVDADPDVSVGKVADMTSAVTTSAEPKENAESTETVDNNGDIKPDNSEDQDNAKNGDQEDDALKISGTDTLSNNTSSSEESLTTSLTAPQDQQIKDPTELDNDFHVQINLAGFDPEEVHVKVVDSDVVVEAESNKQEDGVSVVRKFYRKFTLPPKADVRMLKSKLTSDGQLCIEAPVNEKPVERELAIDFD